MKKIAVLQSNYIPWKGYFDIIGSVDEFIIYDDMQFTKNDWRNRNKIKTPKGLEWLSIPVGQDINRRIRDVEILDFKWQEKHWKTLSTNYSKAPYFKEISNLIYPIYLDKVYNNLSNLNRDLIIIICNYLGIVTKISNSWDYKISGEKIERLINICKQTDSQIYVTGPAAKNYINEELFTNENIKLEWFDYANYKNYNQLWGEFEHSVSILDLLFNCGNKSPEYMKFTKK